MTIIDTMFFSNKMYFGGIKWIFHRTCQKHFSKLVERELKGSVSCVNWKCEDLQSNSNYSYRTVHSFSRSSGMHSNGINSGNFLVPPKPFRSQLCSYHSVQCSLKTQNERGKNFLSVSAGVTSICCIEKRYLSFEWLDRLAVTQAGWYHSLSKSQLVEGLMGFLQSIHDTLHIPWWMSIILSTIMLRSVLTFPLAVYQNYIFAKVENLKPEMDQLIQELKKETAFAVKKYGWTEKHARFMFNRSAKRIWNELIIRENCHPFKASILLLVQIPFWISMSVSFRNMACMMPYQDAAAQILYLELSTGGFLWIPNLTEIDHSLILPIAMGLTSLLITEVNAMSRLQPGSRAQKMITNVFRVISIAIIPIAATVPSCVALYWVTSSMCGLIQNLALMHPGLRRACRIPHSPSELSRPYQHLWSQFQNRITPRK